MASSVYFYALQADLFDVLEFLFDETDARVFEAYSRVNQQLREFHSVEELGVQDPAAANHGRLHLQLCFPSVTSGPVFRRIELNADVGGGYRFKLEDPSAIRIVEGGIRKDIEEQPLYWSEMAHWSEAGARQRSLTCGADLDRINWLELARLSRRIQRFIRHDIAAAKCGTRPILRHAFTEMKLGLKLWRGPGLLGVESNELKIGTGSPTIRSTRSRVKRAPG